MSKCMDCPPGQNKVAVVERWQLLEARLYSLCLENIAVRQSGVNRAKILNGSV